tara:strand:+ start:371 stop:844 length:474 start_codon:yes stop_codon:yes gene_type:complete
MNTLLTIADQNEKLNQNYDYGFTHKWSCRGDGSSRIFNTRLGDQVTRAGGCGYDRFGKVLGNFIEHHFPNELQRLAKRFAHKNHKSSKQFYGLFLNKEGKAYLDGACGDSSMQKVLAAIGFDLERIGESERSNNGEVFYNLKPISKHNRRYWVSTIK